MIAAVFELVYSGTQGSVAELGRLPDTVQFRRISTHPDALVNDRIIVVRVYESLYFANWCPCENTIQKMIDDHNELNNANATQASEKVIGVVINLVSCGYIDATAAYGLLNFTRKLGKQNIAVRCCCVNDKVAQVNIILYI